MARPAWPAPMTRVWVVGMVVLLGAGRRGPAGRSVTGRRRRTGGQPASTEMATGTPLVSTSKTAERLRDCSTTLRELLGVVAAEHEADADLLVAVADLVRQPEDAEQVDVALDGRLDRVEVHAAGRGDVGDAGGEAGGEGVEQELDRRRGVVPPTSTAGWSASKVNGCWWVISCVAP